MQVLFRVCCQVFANMLWRKIAKGRHRQLYHPLLVWTEIKSFIKGSLAALHSVNGYLSLDDYTKLGRKQAPNFSGDRETVYEIFKGYEDEKKRQRMFDECDLIFSLYRRLGRRGAVPEWTLHRIYVDETQDFTQGELAVLLRSCADPNGLFLTGDTAQSIMRGVHFRFKDLRSLFHHARHAALRLRGYSSLVLPRVHNLLYNYRSHAGVLRLASSVVELLQRFFPASFDDNLPRDQGLFEGPQPVLLEACNVSDLALLLTGNKRTGGPMIEFGARQVIQIGLQFLCPWQSSLPRVITSRFALNSVCVHDQL